MSGVPGAFVILIKELMSECNLPDESHSCERNRGEERKIVSAESLSSKGKLTLN